MKDASSSKRTRLTVRPHRGWREWCRSVLLGPIALLMVVNHTLYRRLRDARWRSESTLGEHASGRMLRRDGTSIAPAASFVSGAKSNGQQPRRAVLVGAHEARRRYPGPASLRPPSNDFDDEYEALLGNLQLCLTPAAIGAILEEISGKGLCSHRQLGAVLDRLVDLEACEADVKTALACGGLHAAAEVNALRRVIKLKFDAVSGHMNWHHMAVRSLGFRMSGSGRGFFSKARREQMQLRAAVHFDQADRVIGWDLSPESTGRA